MELTEVEKRNVTDVVLVGMRDCDSNDLARAAKDAYLDGCIDLETYKEFNSFMKENKFKIMIKAALTKAQRSKDIDDLTANMSDPNLDVEALFEGHDKYRARF